jgi:hypothetical protein
MKKLILSTLFLGLIAVVGGTKSLAASPLPAKSLNLITAKFKPLFSKENNVIASESKAIKSWRCFDVTIYTVCGTAWAGDVCLSTNLSYLTNAQFNTAARLKDYEHCGYTQP